MEAKPHPTKGEQYSRALATPSVLLDAGKLIARLGKQAGKFQELSEKLLQRPGDLSEAVLAAASRFKRKSIPALTAMCRCTG